MKALVYRGRGSLVLEEQPQPHPGKGEALLRVDACSICGTDLRIAAGDHRSYADGSGRIPGHEIAGTVVEVGDGASAGIGDRVFVAPNYGCGRCRSCRRGQVNLCDKPRAIGITEDGGFAEYLLLRRDLVDQGNLLRFGDGVDPGAVALAEPLAARCAAHGLATSAMGDVVVVYGAGPIGLFHIALARLAGARAVVVCEPNVDRRQRALAWGATSAHDASFDELQAALEGAGATRGADVVVVAAPVPTAQRQALELAGPQEGASTSSPGFPGNAPGWSSTATSSTTKSSLSRGLRRAPTKSATPRSS